jgi:hypothetical protein
LEDTEDGENMSERVVEKVVGTEKIVSLSLAFEPSDARWVGEEQLG